jgi:hypothetical protein
MNPQLSADQLARFEREGYLVVEDLFTPVDIQPIIDELNAEMEGHIRQLLQKGELSEG